MPPPVVRIPPQQLPGKAHIAFIKSQALKIWADTYDCETNDGGEKWRQSIKDALTIHRNYLRTGLRVRHPKYAIRVSPAPEPPALPKPKIKGFLTRPTGEGSFWLDQKTNLWMPMQF